jgi:hydroxymethylbilane synthase
MSDTARNLIRIATRASKLALWQAHHVADLIRTSAPECEVEIVELTTQGDRDQTGSLAAMGGMGVFTREVQSAVLENRADIAVHSLKDLPTEHAEGLAMGAVPDRESVYDALVLPVQVESADSSSAVFETCEAAVAALPTQARVGTGSIRRRAQLLHARGDLDLQEIRGNVDTRLRKLDDGEFDAIILAEAGLQRLGLSDRISATFGPPLMLGAVGQGALGIECRADDDFAKTVLAQLTNQDVFDCVEAERSLLRALRAGCHAPVAVHTTIDGETLSLEARVLSPDGDKLIETTISDDRSKALDLGLAAADELRSQGAAELLS